MTGDMFHEQVELFRLGVGGCLCLFSVLFKQLGEAHRLEVCLFSTRHQTYDQVQVTSNGAVLETRVSTGFYEQSGYRSARKAFGHEQRFTFLPFVVRGCARGRIGLIF